MSPEDLSTLASKLASFMDGLSEPEREFLADVLATAGATDRSPEVQGFGYKASDQVQRAVYAQQQAINNQQLASDRKSNDRRRAAMDNIQKFLDLTRSMNPNI